MKITKITAREILDSRGNPTVETEVVAEKTVGGAKQYYKAWSGVPSGASTGQFEAVELRDGDPKRFRGKGVQKAIRNVNQIIAPQLIGLPVVEQERIDKLMIDLDGTENKSKLGANAILSVSLAVARLGAMDRQEKLFVYLRDLKNNQKIFKQTDSPSPQINSSRGRDFQISRPFFNIINGGRHAGNNLAIQEFMIAPRFSSLARNYQAGAEIYHQLGEILNERYGRQTTLLGDEGGYAPAVFSDTAEVLNILLEAIALADYEGQVDLALDVAASEFYQDGRYNLGFKREEDQWLSTDELLAFYTGLVDKYPIISIEDPFVDSDFTAFARLKKELPETQIVGDDLTVSNVKRLKKAITEGAGNALLLKVNQVGTVSEAIAAHNLAEQAGWQTMVSHRSGETTDDFIADLAVGLGAGQIKAGAPARGERVCKYNRLAAIEEICKGF